MYYGLKNPNRKQEFINRMNQQIKVNENLIKGLETCEPFIRAFNGKVANSKLIKAIYTAENPNNLSYSITEKEDVKALQSVYLTIITECMQVWRAKHGII